MMLATIQYIASRNADSKRGLVAIAALFALLTAGLLSFAPVSAAEGIRMQALLNADGSGFLGVNTPKEPMTWEACSPTLSNCTPFGSGATLNTAGANPETVFRVAGGDGSIGLSPIWHGNVVSLTPPSVRGSVRANELVTPRAGQWLGGWGGEGDFLQLAACPTKNGSNCTTLTDDHYRGSCPESSAVLDPAFIGDYLRVADQRRGAGPHYMLRYASRSPYAARGGVWEASTTTSAAVVGRIGAVTGPRTERCGFPPLNQASISKHGVATVHCGLGCRAVLIAIRGRKHVREARRLPRWLTHRHPSTLRLSSGALARLGPGRTRIVVNADGRRIARRIIRLG
jgi:hypothetical protein